MPDSSYRNNAARNWLYSFFACVLLVLGTLFALNLHYDPYMVFVRSDYVEPHLNPARGPLVSYSYIPKAAQIIREKPSYILLGTSVVDGGFVTPGSMTNIYDPDPLAFKRMQQLLAAHHPVYNAALRGKNMREAFEYLQHAYANNPALKEVYLGIDWTMFLNEGGTLAPEVSILNQNFVTLDYILRHTLSISSLLETWEMIKGVYPQWAAKQAATEQWWEKAKAHFSANAPASTPPRFTPIPTPNRLAVLKTNSDETIVFVFSAWLIAHMHQKYEDPKYNPIATSVGYLSQMEKFCRDRNITLKVFITTKHPMLWGFVQDFGLMPKVEAWLKAITQITPVWDFTDAIDYGPTPEKYHVGDSLHFKAPGGELILSQLLQEKPTRADVHVVTASTLKRAIDDHRAGLIHWRQTHPEQSRSVDSISMPVTLGDPHAPLEQFTAQLPIFYQPDYHGWRILELMHMFIAVPATKAATLTLNDAVQYKRYGWPSADSPEKLVKLIDAR